MDMIENKVEVGIDMNAEENLQQIDANLNFENIVTAPANLQASIRDVLYQNLSSLILRSMRDEHELFDTEIVDLVIKAFLKISFDTEIGKKY